MNIRLRRTGFFILVLFLAVSFLIACQETGTSPSSPLPLDKKEAPLATQPPSPTEEAASAPAGEETVEGMSAEAEATLMSLEQVDDYPLYKMRFYDSYDLAADINSLDYGATVVDGEPSLAWGCSLFTAFAGAGGALFGRNFDWVFSPAVLLFTDPAGGYASVSMVDIAYLGFENSPENLTQRSLKELRPLLRAPYLPFDGMNEAGLAVGMAAVPAGQGPPDQSKETVGSLGIIRKMLDQAGNVDEAIDLLDRYNVDMGGGPPLHYLIADRGGNSVLAEFYQGELVIIPTETSWHQATNFLRASAGDDPKGQCHRYDAITEKMAETEGALAPESAMDLLAQVAQSNTQWSIVYEMDAGNVSVVMDRTYESVHEFIFDEIGH